MTRRLIKLERVHRGEWQGPGEWQWCAIAVDEQGRQHSATRPTQAEALVRAGVPADTLPPLPDFIWGIFHHAHSIAPGWLCAWCSPAGIMWPQADTPAAAIELALRQHAACVSAACGTASRCIREKCAARCRID